VLVHATSHASRPAKPRLDVVRRRPTQLLQALLKRRRLFLSFRIASGAAHQHADAPHPRRLLRARRKRPCSCAAEQRDEFAPLHSITSSARASNVGGTVRPSAFAVLRLSTKSYLMGACTGRAVGLSPLRMRST